MLGRMLFRQSAAGINENPLPSLEGGLECWMFRERDQAQLAISLSRFSTIASKNCSVVIQL